MTELYQMDKNSRNPNQVCKNQIYHANMPMLAVNGLFHNMLKCILSKEGAPLASKSVISKSDTKPE